MCVWKGPKPVIIFKSLIIKKKYRKKITGISNKYIVCQLGTCVCGNTCLRMRVHLFTDAWMHSFVAELENFLHNDVICAHLCSCQHPEKNNIDKYAASWSDVINKSWKPVQFYRIWTICSVANSYGNRIPRFSVCIGAFSLQNTHTHTRTRTRNGGGSTES